MSNPRDSKPFRNSSQLKKIGIFLLVSSFFLYGVIFLIPFTPYDFAIKTKAAASLFISKEIAFWVAAVILGKEFINKHKNILNPYHWFSKKRTNNQQETEPENSASE